MANFPELPPGLEYVDGGETGQATPIGEELALHNFIPVTAVPAAPTVFLVPRGPIEIMTTGTVDVILAMAMLPQGPAYRVVLAPSGYATWVWQTPLGWKEVPHDVAILLARGASGR